MPETKVVVGGQTDASLDSAVDRAKAKVRELGEETKRAAVDSAVWADEQVKHHLAFEAVTHGVLHAVRHLWSEAGEGISSSMGSAFARVLPRLAAFAGGLGIAYGSVKILSGALWVLDKAAGAAQQGLGGFNQIEGLTTRLKPLTGSLEAARLKLGELAGTFKGTNITLPDATDAYRSAHLQTGGVLSDKAGLTMLGDVATGSGNGIGATSAAVSKLYAELQAGRPVKDTADQLEQMGVISGEVRARMDTMQASGKTGAEVWTMLTGEFKKSSGAMAEARNNLSSLQAAVVQARANLYTTFAESSVSGEKKNLSDRARIIEQLQPVAQEAGDVYGQLGGSASASTAAVNELYDAVLSRAGDLKKWVDVLWLGAGALTAMAVAGIAAAPLVMFGAIALGAAAGVLALAAALGAGAAGLIVWSAHTERTTAAQLALMKGTDSLVDGLKKEAAAMTSVTDKALALGKAYDLLKQTREAIKNAKSDPERDELELRARAIQRQITRIEGTDENTLKPGTAREKSDADKKTAEDALSEATSTFREKLAASEAALVDARQKQFEARQANDDPALQDNGPGQVERREAARLALSGADTAVAKAETDVVKQREAAAGKDLRLEELQVEQRIADLQAQGLARAAQEWTIKRGQLTTQLAAAEAGRDESKAAEARTAIIQGDAAMRGRQSADDDAGRELAAETQIASLQGEGVERIQQESQLRLGLIEARWKEAEAASDAAGMDKQRLAYIQEQTRATKAAEEATQRALDVHGEHETSAAETDQNRRKRQAEKDLAKGKITQQQKRDVEAQIARENEDRARKEARDLTLRSQAAYDKGNPEEGEKLSTQAERKLKDANSFGFDADALTQSTDKPRAIGDSLAKLGLGGNVAPAGLSGLTASNERVVKNTEDMKGLLKQILERPNDTAARFSR